MTRYRPNSAALTSAAALVVGTAAWAGWLVRRRRVWFRRLTDAIPVHSSWWREQRTREGEILYVALGDSAGQGIGASEPGRGYVGATARLLGAVTGRAVRTVNLSISGATTAVALDRQLPALRRLRPDVCTLAIGANDMGRFDPERFERDLTVVLDALPPHAVVAEVPSYLFLPAERSVRRANEILRRLAADRGLEVAPLHALTRRQGVAMLTRQLAGDLFHPNDRGHAVWARAFAPAVRRRGEALAAEHAATPPAAAPDGGDAAGA